MLLTIHNLPPRTEYSDVKELIISKCGLKESILDNLQNEGTGMRVTVGVMAEADAAILVRKVNGLYLRGHQLYVEDKRRAKESEQPYRTPMLQQTQYVVPTNQPGFEYNTLQNLDMYQPNVQMSNYAMYTPVPVTQTFQNTYMAYGEHGQAAAAQALMSQYGAFDYTQQAYIPLDQQNAEPVNPYGRRQSPGPNRGRQGGGGGGRDEGGVGRANSPQRQGRGRAGAVPSQQREYQEPRGWSDRPDPAERSGRYNQPEEMSSPRWNNDNLPESREAFDKGTRVSRRGFERPGRNSRDRPIPRDAPSLKRRWEESNEPQRDRRGERRDLDTQRPSRSLQRDSRPQNFEARCVPDQFEMRPNEFEPRPEKFGRQPNEFEMRPKKFESRPEKFVREPNEFEMRPNKFESRPEKFVRQPNEFEMRPNKFESRPEKFVRQPNEFEMRPNKFESRPEKFGRQPKEFEMRPNKFESRPEKFVRQTNEFEMRPNKFESRPEKPVRQPKEFEMRPNKFDSRPDDFEMRPNKIEPRREKFARRPDKFEPRPNKLEPKPDEFEPHPDKFEQRPDKFKPRPTKFQPRSTKFEPQSDDFEPRIDRFTRHPTVEKVYNTNGISNQRLLKLSKVKGSGKIMVDIAKHLSILHLFSGPNRFKSELRRVVTKRMNELIGKELLPSDEIVERYRKAYPESDDFDLYNDIERRIAGSEVPDTKPIKERKRGADVPAEVRPKHEKKYDKDAPIKKEPTPIKKEPTLPSTKMPSRPKEPPKQQNKGDIEDLPKSKPASAFLKKAIDEETDLIGGLVAKQLNSPQNVLEKTIFDSVDQKECVELYKKILTHHITKRVTNSGVKFARIYGRPNCARRIDLEVFLADYGCISLKKNTRRAQAYTAYFDSYETVDKLCAMGVIPIGDGRTEIYFKQMLTMQENPKLDPKSAQKIRRNLIDCQVEEPEVNLLSKDWKIKKEKEDITNVVKKELSDGICVNGKNLVSVAENSDNLTDAKEAKFTPATKKSQVSVASDQVGAENFLHEDFKVIDEVRGSEDETNETRTKGKNNDSCDWDETGEDWDDVKSKVKDDDEDGDDNEVENDEEDVGKILDFGDIDIDLDDLDEDDLEDY